MCGKWGKTFQGGPWPTWMLWKDCGACIHCPRLVCLSLFFSQPGHQRCEEKWLRAFESWRRRCSWTQSVPCVSAGRLLSHSHNVIEREGLGKSEELSSGILQAGKKLYNSENFLQNLIFLNRFINLVAKKNHTNRNVRGVFCPQRAYWSTCVPMWAVFSVVEYT